MTGLESPLRSRRSAAALAAAAAVVVSANVLANGFAYDDVPTIVRNDSIHHLARLPQALARPYWSDESGRELGIWRPGTTALFGLEWALWGDRPMPYHAVGLALHAGVTGVATLVMAEVVPVGAAFLGGLLFAVHPVHVEAVANVVGEAELLCALFLFLACLVHLRSPPGEGLGGKRIALVAVLYALAFFSKENGAVLPGLLVLLDAWRERLTLKDIPAYLKRRGVLLGVLAAVAVVILALRVRVLGGVTGAYPPLGADLLARIPRIWTLPVIWLNYVRLLFFPADLIPDYSPSVIDVQIGWNAVNVAGVLVVLTLLGLAWASWRSASRSGGGPSGGGRSGGGVEGGTDLRPLALGILWFGVALLPVANVVFLAGVLLAERTLYVPSFGFALAGGTVLWLLRLRRPRLTVAAAALVVAAFGARSWTGNRVWKSTGTVLNHLLHRHPESGRVQWMLADHLWTDRKKPKQALELYRLAVGINGTNYPLMVEIAHRLVVFGAPAQAAAIARWEWKDYPDLPDAPAVLALALSQEGKNAEAIEPALAALHRNPDNALLHHILAVAYRTEGAWRKAIEQRRAAIEDGEGDQWLEWRWLAELELRAGDTAAAAAAVDSARARTREPSARRVLDSLEAVLGRGDTTPETTGQAGPRGAAEENPKGL